MRKRVVLGLGAGLLWLGGSALAADVEVPPEFHGVWGTPACSGEGTVLVHFSHGSLEINANEAAYRPVQTLEAAGDWVKQERDGAPSFMRISDQNVLRVAVATTPKEAPAPARPQQGQQQKGQQQQQKAQPAKPRLPLAGPPTERDPPDAWTYTDYARCRVMPSAFAIPHGEAVAVLAGLDQMRAACGSNAASDAACGAGLFKLADVSGNNEISIAELARVGRVATYFATTMGGEATPVGEILAAYAGAVAITPLLAKAIVVSFDYDDSGALSLSELMQNREALFESADAQALSVAARPKIEGLIEQLKGAEQMLRLLLQ